MIEKNTADTKKNADSNVLERAIFFLSWQFD